MKTYFQNIASLSIKVLKSNQTCPYNLEAGRVFNIRDLMPKRLCSFAFHSAFPYCLTFDNGGYFKWSKNKKAVLAQCPNPNGGVVMEISRQTDKKTQIKIVGIKGKCAAGHKIGEKFAIDKTTLNFCPQAFDALFAHANTLLAGNQNEKMQVSCPVADCRSVFELRAGTGKRKLSVCDCVNFENLNLEAVRRTRACGRYHKFLNEEYNLEEVKPQNLCLEAYHTVYPHCLALLYGAKFRRKESVNLRCPGVEGSVLMKVSRRRRKGALGWNFLETASRIVGHPVDFIDSEIFIEVLGKKGECPAGLKIGQVFRFNTGRTKEICPAAFDSLYPSLVLLGRKRKVPWTKEREKVFGWCPDNTTNITYQIIRNGLDPRKEEGRVYCEQVGENLLKSFDRLLERAGLEKLIKAGETILIKPNICAPLLPSSGGITKPLLVVYLAEKIKKLGAMPIVAEGAIGYGITEKAFRVSGLSVLCKKRGVKLLNLDEDSFITKEINGKKLKSLRICATVGEVDKIINFPVLKTHLYTQVTLSLKNLLGLAWRSQKSLIHVVGINQGLADLNLAIKPVLNLMDATVAMEGEGPTRGIPKKMGLLLASTDRVALDTICCYLMGIKNLPEHIELAEKLGIGTTKAIFDSILPLEKLTYPFRLASKKNLVLDRLENLVIGQPWFHKFIFKKSKHQAVPASCYPFVEKKLCSKCYTCITICPFRTMKKDHDGFPKCETKSCVKCYACVEICPTGALRENEE